MANYMSVPASALRILNNLNLNDFTSKDFKAVHVRNEATLDSLKGWGIVRIVSVERFEMTVNTRNGEEVISAVRYHYAFDNEAWERYKNRHNCSVRELNYDLRKVMKDIRRLEARKASIEFLLANIK